MAALHQETAQASAHILRPVAVAHQAASTVARLANAAKNAFLDKDVVPEGETLTTFMFTVVQQIEELTRLSLTAAVDAADCLACLNADTLRCLGVTWLDASRLPGEIKDAVKCAPIELGKVPQE